MSVFNEKSRGFSQKKKKKSRKKEYKSRIHGLRYIIPRTDSCSFWKHENYMLSMLNLSYLSVPVIYRFKNLNVAQLSLPVGSWYYNPGCAVVLSEEGGPASKFTHKVVDRIQLLIGRWTKGLSSPLPTLKTLVKT